MVSLTLKLSKVAKKPLRDSRLRVSLETACEKLHVKGSMGFLHMQKEMIGYETYHLDVHCRYSTNPYLWSSAMVDGHRHEIAYVEQGTDIVLPLDTSSKSRNYVGYRCKARLTSERVGKL